MVFDYGYDASGLVTSQDVNQASWEWSPATSAVTLVSETYDENNLDQYETAGGRVYDYDDNGNMTEADGRIYTYSAENQLLQADTLSGGTVQYSYGPGARRVRKNIVGGSVTSFIHAGGMEIAEYDGSGNILRRYIPGPGVDQRIALIECDETDPNSACAANDAGTETQYYFADRLGNVLAVTDNTGDIVQQFFYTPFGVEMVGDEGDNPFRYTGRKYDPETGLYYYRARYYDADLGRFLQVDPIGYEDQWNLYAYVGNNPLNASDPSGKCTVPVIAQLCAGGLSAGLELAFQGAEIALGIRTEIDPNEIGVAFATGTVGAGFVRHARRAGVLGEMLLDAGVSAADKLGDGDELNGEFAASVVVDVIAGRAVEGFARRAGRGWADDVAALGDPGSDLRRRYPTRRQRHRRDTAERWGNEQGEAVEMLVGSAASEFGSRVAEGGTCIVTRNDSHPGERGCPGN